MKQRILSILLSVIMILGVMPTSLVLASENSSTIDIKSETQFQETIEIIEDDLNAKGTDIDIELNKLISIMEKEKSIETNQDEIAKLQSLINETTSLLNDYRNYTSDIQTYGITHPVYSPAVAAVIAFFSSSGYLLAAELLIHAKNNNVLNSRYIPYYGPRINASTVVLTIKQGPNRTGTAAFTNSGSKVQKDLYYAIHKFSYRYVRNPAPSKFYLTDYYDFAPGDYEGIAGTAINTMWMAQVLGVLVPYYVNITV